MRTGRLLRETPAHSDPVTALCFSFDGTMLISGSFDGLVRVWDARNGHCLKSYASSSNSAPVNDVMLSRNGECWNEGWAWQGLRTVEGEESKMHNMQGGSGFGEVNGHCGDNQLTRVLQLNHAAAAAIRQCSSHSSLSCSSNRTVRRQYLASTTVLLCHASCLNHVPKLHALAALRLLPFPWRHDDSPPTHTSAPSLLPALIPSRPQPSTTCRPPWTAICASSTWRLAAVPRHTAATRARTSAAGLRSWPDCQQQPTSPTQQRPWKQTRQKSKQQGHRAQGACLWRWQVAVRMVRCSFGT